MKLKYVFVVLALGAVQAQAETVFNWTGSGGNSDWGTAANWSSGIVPGAGTNVVILGSGADVTVNYTGTTGNVRLVTIENTPGFVTRLTISTPGFVSFVDALQTDPTVLSVGTNSEVRVSGTGTAQFRSGGWAGHYIYGKVIVDDGVFEGFGAQVFYIEGGVFTVNAGRVWLDSCGGNAPVSVVVRSGATMNVNGGVVTVPENLMVGGGTSFSTNSLWMTNGVLRLGVGGAGPAGRTTYPGASGIGGGNTYGRGYFSGGVVTNLNAVLVGNDHWNGPSAQWILTGDAKWRQFGGDIAVGSGRGTAYYTNAANASLVTTNNLIFGAAMTTRDSSYGYGILAGGSVTVTNAVGTAELRIRRGSLIISGATVTADTFVMATNATANAFVFTGGTFTVSQVTMTNRLAFGGGTVPAVLTLLGGQSSADGGCFVSTNGVLKGSGTLTVKSGFVSLFKNATLDPDGTLELTKFSAQQSLAVPYAIGDLVRSDTLDFSGLTAGRLTVSIPLSVPPLAIRYEDRFAVFTASSGTITGFDPADWSVQVLNADYASTSAKLVNGGDGTIYLTGFGNVKGTRILLR